MIPILYTADEKYFTTNGIGRLSDCTRFIVTEERNGIYEAEFDYPITGLHYDEIELGMIVAATHDDRRDLQPFVIYQKTVPDLNGIVTFNAHHISYKLSGVTVMPFTAGSVAATLQGIKDNSANPNPFTFWTDKATTKTFKLEVPKSARSILGGEEGSILDTFGGGEYEFDRFTVKLYAHRGQDSDVEIRYSKNLTDLHATIDESGTYNAIVPFWADSEGNVVTLPDEIIVYSGLEPKYAYLTDERLIIIREENGEPIEVPYYDIVAQPMDLSDVFDAMPTPSQLESAARSRFESSGAWMPSDTLEIDFIQLWQTAEFAQYSALQRVSLCDTVSVYYPQAGIKSVKQKVVKTTYNVLLDRYDSIELGQVATSLAQQIRKGLLKEVPTTSMMEDAILYASNMIRGGLGGYVVMTPGPNGYPQEILIMDTPDINTAVNVWRFNQGGLGHSSTGYHGPYSDIALTQDGRINASLITTGILNANVVRAGLISDASGLNYWNLDTGEFSTKKGSIAAFNIYSEYIRYAPSDGRALVLLGRGGLSTAWHRTSTLTDPYTYYYTETAITSSSYLNWSVGLGSSREAAEDDLYNFVRMGVSVIGGSYGVSPAFYIAIQDELESEVGRIWFSNRATQPIHVSDDTNIHASLLVNGDLTVSGTKSRAVETPNYSDRLLYAYETPTPLFGDIGEAKLDEEGICYVDIDDIFSETIADRVEYQVFLQKEGEGDCWISDKNARYFVIQGTPGLKVAWELKAKQKDYSNIRLEMADNGLEEYSKGDGPYNELTSYIKEQEDILYGSY